MIEKIIRIVKQYLEESESTVTEGSLLKEDLGLDSFDIMNIIIDCEDEFDIRVCGEVIGDFITVKDIERVLLKKGRGSNRQDRGEDR